MMSHSAAGAAFEADFAGGWRHQSVDCLEQGGFAGAAAAQQHHGFTGGDVERDVAQHRPPAQNAGEVADFEDGGEGTAKASFHGTRVRRGSVNKVFF